MPLRRRHPGDLAKKENGRNAILQLEIMTRATNGKSCGVLSGGEHLAAIDWAIAKSCDKSQAKTKARPGAVNKTQSHSLGGRT